MKKLFFAATAMVLFTACSSDSDGGSSTSTTFAESHIMIDGVLFRPTANDPDPNTIDFIETKFTANYGGSDNDQRFFGLTHYDFGDTPTEDILLGIMIPGGQTPNGTYNLVNDNFPDANQADGSYIIDMDSYRFISGSVTVTDLGSNKYKLVFNNAVVKDADGPTTKTITGYFEGTFDVDEF
jgi:hypothetical protein